MKASELRIGNWVYDDEAIVSKVIGIMPFEHSIRCDEEEGCLIGVDLYLNDGEIRKGFECDSNFIKPIPVTEEWLLKFDILKSDHIIKFPRRENGMPKLFGRWITKTGLIDLKELETPFLRIDATHTDIYYVHQLQNYYHSVTGEELEIKA